MTDVEFCEKLIRLAHSAQPPGYNNEFWGDTTFQAAGGFQVVIFYDCGELDYIDSFVFPDGTIFDVWADDDDGKRDVRTVLRSWCGVEDTDALISSLPQRIAH